MLMLAGGLPSPAYFPYESISAEVLAPNAYKATPSKRSIKGLWSTLFKSNDDPVEKKTAAITINKYEKGDPVSTIQLSTALQYSQATGLVPLQGFIRQFSQRVFQPATADWDITLCSGSTAAWAQIVTTLCNPGDGFLVEEATYPSAVSTAWPSGMRPVAVSMDNEGLSATGLAQVLEEWDVEARGGMQR